MIEQNDRAELQELLVRRQPARRTNGRHTGKSDRHDVDPQLYLTQLLINLPAAQLSELPAWLPDQWKIRQAAQMPAR